MTTLLVKSAKKPSAPARRRTKWSPRKPKRKPVKPCAWYGRFTVTTVNGSGVRSYDTDRLPGVARAGRYGCVIGLTPSMRRSMDAFYSNVDALLYLDSRREWYHAQGLEAPFDAKAGRGAR